MNTIITVIGLVLFGILALTVFGMTITNKDYEDFEYLSRFVDECEATGVNKGMCLEEWQRLYGGGRIPIEEIEELRRRIIKKFR